MDEPGAGTPALVSGPVMENLILLDLRAMREPEDRVERDYPATAFATGDDDDYAVAGSVTLALDSRKDGEQCGLVGRLRTSLRLTCCRCLDPFVVPVDVAIDLLYLPQTENRGEAESEISDDDLSTAFYREEQIDLGQLVREQLQLTVPMKPLCRDGCQGLCPVCGINRNQERCECVTGWKDPRLAALEGLLSARRRY
jgi:uncharacterized protein